MHPGTKEVKNSLFSFDLIEQNLVQYSGLKVPVCHATAVGLSLKAKQDTDKVFVVGGWTSHNSPSTLVQIFSVQLDCCEIFQKFGENIEAPMRYIGCGFDESAGFVTFGGQFQNLRGSKSIKKGK